MGQALLRGILNKGLFKRSQIIVSDKDSLKLARVRGRYGVSVAYSNTEAAKQCDTIILAVKPRDIPAVLKELGSVLKTKLTITIAAGITTAFIRNKTGSRRIIRAMPNAPALVGCGITAISAAKGATAKDINIADRIFKCAGEIIHLPEKSIDLITAVSGSGPAYFFALMEAMIEAALSCGLNQSVAERLVLQTAFGAATLQHQSKVHPSLLREKVASKGGTTQAALEVFKKKKFKSLIKEAIKAAARRAKELSK